jgi:hypothetical protein
MPLLISVMSSFCCMAQVGPPSGGLGVGRSAKADTVSPVGALSPADSLSLADSLMRLRLRELSFPAVIDIVLRDFPNNLRNITGELTMAQGEIDNYASIVALPGAEDCTITRYHSIRDTTASWQAKMYSSDDFGKASRLYRELYQKLAACQIQLVDGSIVYLKGKWEPVKDGASFTTSVFRLDTVDWHYSEVRVELELVYLLADWGVHINIVSKKDDDAVGGTDATGL